MSATTLLEQLKQLTNTERLLVIEAATRLARDDLAPGAGQGVTPHERQLRDAAEQVKDLYQPGGELTEWTALDAEEFADDHLQG